MSGIIGSRLNVRGSGLVSKLGTDGQVLTSAGAGVAAAFEDVAGGVSWQSVVTASTLTAVAGNGYPINTTSNTCTITLPASASNGDQIVFTDYARNWGTNKIIIDSNGLKYQGDADTFTVEYTTDGQSLNIVYSGSTKGWIPIEDDTVTEVPEAPSLNASGIFGFGVTSGYVGMTNLVNSSGTVADDVSAVGTARGYLAACEYGNDKAIFGFGTTGSVTGVTNLVSNTGVVATDTSAVGTARMGLAAATYGGDKGIFGYGSGLSAVTNLVNSSGVVATDTSGVGTARRYLAATQYSTNKDKAIFAYGDTSGNVSMSNLVSNSGVVATDVTGVGTARHGLAACGYGGDKAIFGYGDTGSPTAVTNLVSNAGVVATDTSGVGSASKYIAACEYGNDKGVFGFGKNGATYSKTNRVSNTGVVATDTASGGGVTAREGTPAGCSFA
jgi:hypothetical protein